MRSQAYEMSFLSLGRKPSPVAGAGHIEEPVEDEDALVGAKRARVERKIKHLTNCMKNNRRASATDELQNSNWPGRRHLPRQQRLRLRKLLLQQHVSNLLKMMRVLM